MKHYLWSALLLLASYESAFAAVTAQLDHDQIAPGDTVQLVLQHDGQVNTLPDLAPLKQDFDVLATSRSSNVQIINGNMSAKTQVQLTLSPKQSGRITVPSLTWDSEHSAPMTLLVSGTANSTNPSGNPSGNTATNNKIFLQTNVDQAQPYVQAAVNVTVRLYTTEQLYQASLDLPASNDVLVQQVGKDISGTAEKNGVRYQTVERHYILFPQHSGEVKVPGAVLNGQVANGDESDLFSDDPFSAFFGKSQLRNLMTSTKPIRVHANEISLSVRPRPAGASNSNYWLPARNVTVNAAWHPDQSQTHVGDPVTLDLHLQAEDLTAAQLPDLSAALELPAGIKAYPDQAKLNNSVQSNGTSDAVIGSRDQSIALIADQPGEFIVPALHVHWWDTKSNAAREAILPARTLQVLPAIGTTNTQSRGQSATSPATQINNASSPTKSSAPTTMTDFFKSNSSWLWISAVLALLWIVTMVAWWFSRRHKTPKPIAATKNKADAHPNASDARRQFHDACHRNDAQLARKKLLEWAAAISSDAPTGLNALAKHIDNTAITPLLLQLDRACYAEVQWNGAALADVLRDLPQPTPPKRPRAGTIAPLYP